MINAIHTALSGLVAASRKAEASAANIANLQTAGALTGNPKAPYSPVMTTQTARAEGGVETSIVAKNTPFVPVYAPDSPFANEEGLIGIPNVDLAEEAVNLTLAETAYKANAKILNTQSEMQKELLRTLDKEV